MFKIRYLKVNYEDKSIEPSVFLFEDSVYIFGHNNVGKTLLLKAIDYVLGKSDMILEDIDGFENIYSFEAKLLNETRTLFITRSKNNEYGYKYSEEDKDYLTVDFEMYKQEITSFLGCKYSKYFEEFKIYSGENLSFRAFSFINFLDEKGFGNLINIFTRLDNYHNQKRARNLMTFIFNYKNVIRLIELTKEQAEILAELKDFANQKATYNYSLSLIKQEFVALQIPFNNDDSLQSLQESFKTYSNNFHRKSTAKINSLDDLGILMRISCSLSEELKYQENLKRQTQLLDNRNVKAEKLLNAFKELALLDDSYSSYIDDIDTLIKRQIFSHEILSIKDFEKTIQEIKDKKSEIDRQIAICQKGLNKDSYENIYKSIGIIEQAFCDIEKIPNLSDIADKEKRLKQIEEQLKKLRNDFDSTLQRKFDEIMLKLYKELDGKVQFASDDFKQKNFKILFDPIKITLYGERLKDGSEDVLVKYIPGSMARETTWQIIAYLAMFKLIKENFYDLPLMPILFIDGLDQPYDEEKNSYPNIYKFIREKAMEIGIQLFVVSTHNGEDMGIKDQLNIKGFNKTYKR